MSKKCSGNIQETIAAIDLIIAAKSQAPSGNKTIQNMLTDNETILVKRLVELWKQDKVPAKKEEQSLALKRKSKGKEVIENDNDPRRPD